MAFIHCVCEHMSFVSLLFPELRGEIAQWLDLGARHALARTCRVLLSEDGGTTTRLPEPWVRHLRNEEHTAIYRHQHRKLMWRLHALGFATCTNEMRWRPSGGPLGMLIRVEAGDSLVSLEFSQPTFTYLDGSKLYHPIFMRMVLPLPSVTDRLVWQRFDCELTRQTTENTWLIDAARLWLTKRAQETSTPVAPSLEHSAPCST